MNDFFTLLNEAEIERLDQFLLNRIDDNEDTEGKEKVRSVDREASLGHAEAVKRIRNVAYINSGTSLN